MEITDAKEMFELRVKVKCVLAILNGCSVEESIKIIANVIDTLGEATNSSVFEWYDILVNRAKCVHGIAGKDQE